MMCMPPYSCHACTSIMPLLTCRPSISGWQGYREEELHPQGQVMHACMHALLITAERWDILCCDERGFVAIKCRNLGVDGSQLSAGTCSTLAQSFSQQSAAGW